MRQDVAAAGLLALALTIGTARCGNPVVPGVGMADPHLHVWGAKNDSAAQTVFMYATHDWHATSGKLGFRMDNWWVWSSDDLVTWTQRDILQPTDTYIHKNFTECWATDAARSANGSYYFYLSVGPTDVGVVTSQTPVGPWKDPLGKALIPDSLKLPGNAGSRDPGILQDDDGSNYLIFGTFQYYMARLNEDMISLAEAPRAVKVINAFGPIGAGKLDDKAFLHKYNGMYYLSWGCFYGISHSLQRI